MSNKKDAKIESDPFFQMAVAGTAVNTEPAQAKLLVTNIEGVTEVRLRAPYDLVRSVGAICFGGVEPQPEILFRLDYAERKISIFPQVTYFSDRLYQQKYDEIREIQLDFNAEVSQPLDHDEALSVLANLPGGFIKDPAFGLGLIKEMRPLIQAIERIKGISRLVIGQFEMTHVNGNSFFMPEAEYLQLRIRMNRIVRGYQAESLRDREIMAHNASLHQAKPEEFAAKERPYRPGMIYKLLGGSNIDKTKLRGKDRRGILNLLAVNAKELADRDPKEFVQLQKDIELVSLDRLIASCELKFRQNCQENEWQSLLELNPFILSMLFGQPVILIQAGASVGGQKVSGSGTKITDFLIKNPLSQNAALVELKTPRTPLFGNKYRDGVYSPSSALMGAIVQVLDQRLKLITDIAGIKHRNNSENIKNLQVYAMECVVVAGQMPETEEKRSSFELMRNQMKDVRLITFDEMIERLHLLRELLSGERYISDHDDDDDLNEIPHEKLETDHQNVCAEPPDYYEDDELPF